VYSLDWNAIVPTSAAATTSARTRQGAIPLTDEEAEARAVHQGKPNVQTPAGDSGATRDDESREDSRDDGRVRSATPSFFFPVYERFQREKLLSWHARTRLGPDREGLLVDVGAHDNLVGSEWVTRMAEIVNKHGRRIEVTKMAKSIGVEGVGKGAQECVDRAKVPLALPGGSTGTYDAPVVPDSSVPALLGLSSLRRNRAVIDVVTNTMYFMGPGDYQIQQSPGSTKYNLVQSQSGHLLLPVSEFADVSGAAGSNPGRSLALHHRSSV
jgi:hypothetical protein